MKEEIIKMFHRIELDKTNDSCGFEFADGFSCTFDNIATCYDDRLKLYDLVKDLQSRLKAKEEAEKEFKEWIANEQFRLARSVSHSYKDSLNKTRLVNEEIFDELAEVLDKYNEILSKGENK